MIISFAFSSSPKFLSGCHCISFWNPFLMALIWSSFGIFRTRSMFRPKISYKFRLPLVLSSSLSRLAFRKDIVFSSGKSSSLPSMRSGELVILSALSSTHCLLSWRICFARPSLNLATSSNLKPLLLRWRNFSFGLIIFDSKEIQQRKSHDA